MKKYAWRDGFRMKGDAQSVGETIEHLRVKHGGLIDRKIVVDAARDKKSILHNFFEWDDSEAAKEWRLDQASKLIGSIIVITEEAPDLPVRAFVSVREGGKTESPFTDIGSAMLDEKMRRIVLNNAISELAAVQRKYSALEELAEVFDAIKRVKTKQYQVA